jgi:8-oxo-dGTP diphosphatase
MRHHPHRNGFVGGFRQRVSIRADSGRFWGLVVPMSFDSTQSLIVEYQRAQHEGAPMPPMSKIEWFPARRGQGGSAMHRPQKVVAYIVRDDRIVVLSHPDLPWDQAGLQVPAGTIREGELPEDAVLREAHEETGLDGLRIVRYLGMGEYDMRPYADAIHARHYFHLTVDGDNLPERWEAFEVGDGDHEPIRFKLYWIPISQAHAVAGGQAALLGRILD